MINHFIEQAYMDPFAPRISGAAITLTQPMTQTLFHVDCKFTRKKICTCAHFVSPPIKE